MFSILCVHFFIAYDSEIGAIDVNQRFLAVDIIWRTSFHIYKTIRNI